MSPRGLTLDAGALIAVERGDLAVRRWLKDAERNGDVVVVPAAVLGQVWRSGRRQARLVRFLASGFLHHPPEVQPLDRVAAVRIGELCAWSGTTDVVDASVVVCAQDRRHVIVTSDPKDIAALDPTIPVMTV